MTTADSVVVAGTPATTTGPGTGWGDVDVAQAEPTVIKVNATEDGDEPMGEAPEIGATGFQILGTDHLGASEAPKIIARADQVTAQAQALNEIRDVHRRYVESLRRREHGGAAANVLACSVGAILERNQLC